MFLYSSKKEYSIYKIKEAIDLYSILYTNRYIAL